MGKFRICCHLIQFKGQEKEDPRKVLQAVADAGYEAAEGFAPADATELVEIAALAAEYGLHIVNIGAPDWKTRVEFNAALGNDAVEVPPVDRQRGEPLTPEDLNNAEAELRAPVDYAIAHHLKPFHHAHVGTIIETKEDTDMVLEAVPGLQLLLDTGHMTAAGSSALQALYAHPDRIGHVHLKDFHADDPATYAHTLPNAWEVGRFAELGQGNMGLSIPAILKGLEEIGYPGWISVELDTAPRDPARSAQINREYLRGLGY